MSEVLDAFRVAAKGRLDGSRLERFLEYVDESKFLDWNGQPDTARIAAQVAHQVDEQAGARTSQRAPAAGQTIGGSSQGDDQARRRFGDRGVRQTNATVEQATDAGSIDEKRPVDPARLYAVTQLTDQARQQAAARGLLPPDGGEAA